MENQTIVKLEAAKFQIAYSSKPDFKLIVDFSSLIQAFRLSGKFCLLHWQAKPVGERRFGVYDSASDFYYPTEYQKLQIDSFPIPLQVDEKVIATVPTAVLYFKQSVFIAEKPSRIVYV